jgi:diguanylate cyclase (GGDEF)-like protein
MRPLLSTRAAEKPPRLIVRFVFFTALGLALAAVAITSLVRTGGAAQAQRNAIERARFAADAVLERELRSADVTSRPVTSRRRELDRLLQESVLLEGIAGVALYDAEGRLTYATGGQVPAALPRSQVRETLRGVATSSLAGGVLHTQVPLVLGPARTTGIAVFDQDYGPIAAAGRRSAWLAAAILEGLLLLLFVVLAPVLLRVTRRIRSQIAELEHAATHDEPTGTANREALKRAVEKALGSGLPGTLLLVDVDGFSELNDVFGSDGGDAVLLEIALRLRWELADCELVARLGEDEFAVLIASDSPSVVDRVAERIGACLAAPITVDAVPIAVTASIGAATLDDDALDFATVLRRASVALSAAKETRDGRVRTYEPALDTRGGTRELREALENDELLVHFQPQADLATRQIRGVEALIRWQHPTRGLLAAGEFIHQAEQSGLAKDIRRVVLESSARCWHDWDRLGLRLEIAVNLSAVDVHDTLLPDEVAVLLEVWGIPPWNLVLEITERTLIVDERRAAEVLGALGALGVRLAIDDFGSGYSSLASLQRFPVQIVKLDRSLIAGLPGEPGAEAIVRGSIDLAHALGAIVVAEGIETDEQWETVRALGCDVAQGYLIGRPMPAEDVARALDGVPAVTHIVAA